MSNVTFDSSPNAYFDKIARIIAKSAYDVRAKASLWLVEDPQSLKSEKHHVDIALVVVKSSFQTITEVQEMGSFLMFLKSFFDAVIVEIFYGYRRTAG